MKKKLIDSNGMTGHYLVELESGEWPLNQDIINFCDPNNFGGTVRISENIAFVNVYVD
jgi:hypothetical protein